LPPSTPAFYTLSSGSRPKTLKPPLKKQLCTLMFASQAEELRAKKLEKHASWDAGYLPNCFFPSQISLHMQHEISHFASQAEELRAKKLAKRAAWDAGYAQGGGAAAAAAAAAVDQGVDPAAAAEGSDDDDDGAEGAAGAPGEIHFQYLLMQATVSCTAFVFVLLLVFAGAYLWVCVR
jgi:hypothetical protein